MEIQVKLLEHKEYRGVGRKVNKIHEFIKYTKTLLSYNVQSLQTLVSVNGTEGHRVITWN
jgi:hypothetical protein